ncbi:Prefoldin subunit-domain-containing protein [Aspergillus nidulans var. acristatus]
MGVPDSNIEGLERQRRELESNILQLQQSLYHWRTWEAEYEGLKEGIGDLGNDATTNDFLRVSRKFGGTFVNEDEFRVIIGEKQGLRRTRQQVIDLISRRIDYVKANVASMEKRLRAAESQMEALDSAEHQPRNPADDFPMREIIEELDENGEVISSRTMNPGDQASSLLEILKKAGVKDIPDLPKRNAPASIDTHSPDTASEDTFAPAAEQAEQEGQKKEGQEDASQELVSSGSNEPSSSASDAVETPADVGKETPVVDVDESPEDAQLRREMLRYGLDEVGAVVAELELDDDASEISIEEEYDPYPYDDEDEEEEDEYGRSIGPVLDEDYHRQMRELEAKLNARGMWNVGKDTASLPADVKEDLEHPVKVEKTPEANGEPAYKAKPKKKVAFADDLDIAPTPKPPVPESKNVIPRNPDVPVLSESIIERTTPEKASAAVDAPAPKKTSRFKTARGTAGTIANASSSAPSTSSQRKPASPEPTPSMPLFPAKPAEPKPFSQSISDILEKPPSAAKPKGKILADTLVERNIPEGTATAPEPEELDEELHRKEIATEFHRMKNRMARQNGSSFDEEQEMVSADPREPPKRISKFRASRMV